MKPSADMVEALKRVRWRRHAALTPAARRLIEAHRAAIAPVVAHLARRHGLKTAVAHGHAITPAHGTQEYSDLLDRLFDEVTFEGAGQREPIIMAVSACGAWDLDPELRAFPNPWVPLVNLVLMGYPVSFADSPDQESTSLCVGLRDGIVEVPLL